jgi:hypothetical protein
MSLQQQAALAQGIVNSMSLDMQRQETQLNNRYVLAKILSQEMANEEFRWQLEQVEQASKAASKTSSSSSSELTSALLRPPITVPASRLKAIPWSLRR